MNKITTAQSLPAAFGLSRSRSAFHRTRSGGTGVAPSMTRGSEKIGMAVGRAWYDRGIGCERRRWWRETRSAARAAENFRGRSRDRNSGTPGRAPLPLRPCLYKLRRPGLELTLYT